MFFVAYKYYVKARITMGSRGKERSIGYNFYKSTVIGLAGYFAFYLVGMVFVFNSTDYVRDRIEYERKVGFNRANIDALSEEYPFAKKAPNLLNDFEVRNRLTGKDLLVEDIQNSSTKSNIQAKLH